MSFSSQAAPLSLVVLLALAACSAESRQAASETTNPGNTPSIEEQADAQLQAMADFLQKQETFAFDARQTFDSRTRTLGVTVTRPDKLRAEIAGEQGQQTVVYDGSHLNIEFQEARAWAAVETPDSLDTMADHLDESYGMSLPLADLFATSPYASLVVPGTTGRYAGLQTVEGLDCHQLEFENEAVDWQICVAADGQPLPRRFSITYKDQPGAPQRSTLFTDWDLDPAAPAETFVFDAPDEFEEIPFAPTTDSAPSQASP